VPQQKWTVKVQTIAGRFEVIEVRADSQAEAMTRASKEDFVRNVITAWEGAIR
jgi:hypothetical protein